MRYLTRLCWNTTGWTRPSGVAAQAEGPNRGGEPTFVSQHEYGHEEWLFCPAHRIEQMQYGFVQGALRTARQGQRLDLVLYTIDPEGERLYLGRIDQVEVLDDAAAASARDEFDRRGWSVRMRQHLRALRLQTSTLQVPRGRSREIVNVRFRMEDVHMLPERLTAPPDDITRAPGMNRYQFYPLDPLSPVLQNTPADPARPTDAYRYQTAPVIDADRRHNRLQLHLTALLRARYGHDAVFMEVGGVDIVLRVNGVTTFIEVKSNDEARLAIRAALGQLLEYALFALPEAGAMPELVIAAPAALDDAAAHYLALLRTRHQLSVRYVQVDEKLDTSPL